MASSAAGHVVCGSSRLEDIATGLRYCAELYQHWSQEFARDAPRDIAAEHQTIAHLTVARDEVGATQALREHIQRTTTAALVRYAEQLDGIDDERALD